MESLGNAPRLALLLGLATLPVFVAGCSRSPAGEAPPASEGTAAAPPAAPAPVTPQPTPSAASPTPTGAPTAGGLTWTAPAAFQARTPESRMRAAEYVAAAPGGGDPAVLAVFFFGTGQGGAVDANVERWLGQFTDAKGKPVRDKAKVEKSTRGAFAVTMVDVTGTYSGGMPAMGVPGETQPNQRMLGAIVEGPNGPVFFKMTGPKAAVDGAEAAFQELIDSVK